MRELAAAHQELLQQLKQLHEDCRALDYYKSQVAMDSPVWQLMDQDHGYRREKAAVITHGLQKAGVLDANGRLTTDADASGLEYDP